MKKSFALVIITIEEATSLVSVIQSSDGIHLNDKTIRRLNESNAPVPAQHCQKRSTGAPADTMRPEINSEVILAGRKFEFESSK